MATAIPPDLVQAISSASIKYGVPPDLLVGIWRKESNSSYPNNYANGLGYGGLFGTQVVPAFGPASEVRAVPTPSVQQQADTAASILRTGLLRSAGATGPALSYYNSGKLSGGYTSVPGQTTGPQLSQQQLNTLFTANTSALSVGGAALDVVKRTVEALIAGPGGNPAIDVSGSAASAAGKAVSAVGGGIGGLLGLPNWFTDPTGWLLRGAQIVAGGVLVLVGLYLLAKQIGLAPDAPGPVRAAAALAE